MDSARPSPLRASRIPEASVAALDLACCRCRRRALSLVSHWIAMAAPDLPILRTVLAAALGAIAELGGLASLATGGSARAESGRRHGHPAERAHVVAPPTTSRITPAKSAALRRDVQEVFETKEAAIDLEVLDRSLRDIRDLTGADEAIFWRWVEARQTLVPSAWSTEGESRPAFFDVRAWGPLVKWSAEERDGAVRRRRRRRRRCSPPPRSSARRRIYGVLTVSARGGLQLDRDSARAWMPRFAAQVASLIQLFDLRREYGRHMRQSQALLDAVQRLQGHRSREARAGAVRHRARRDVGADRGTRPVERGRAARRGAGRLAQRRHRAGLSRHRGFARWPSRASSSCRSCSRMQPPQTAEHCPFGGLAAARGVGGDRSDPERRRTIGALIVEGAARWRRVAARGEEHRSAGRGGARTAGDRVGDRGGEPSRAHRLAHRAGEPSAFRRAAASEWWPRPIDLAEPAR